MKLILFLVISCLALNNGRGAPRTAVYKFVRCNPDGDQANCVIHKSQEVTWSPNLQAKLPASTAQYLKTEPVDDESPLWEEEDKEDKEEEEEEEDEEEEESPMTSEDREFPVVPEEGSGLYEGSAAEGPFMAEQASLAEMGSGESWTEKDIEPFRGGRADRRGMRQLFPSRSLLDEAKPAEQELKEDHLLQL